MASDHQLTKECSNNHNFQDLCNSAEHNSAFVASHLHEPIKGAPLYKEAYIKEKIKTVNVALVVCLNMDIDPPDVQKIPPFSRIEAWVDPSDAGFRVVDMIGKNLQLQYERWQPKACYRQCLDPNLEEVKKMCINLRRNTRTDRILFHYNGHGVPRPTENGEIWVFNKSFTKYIPVSLYDLQRWLGGPAVYVIDCQNAGRVLKLFEYFCKRRQTEMINVAENRDEDLQQNPVPNAFCHPYGQHQNPPAAPAVTMDNTIMLCACQENEDLPQLAELPADLFTACLTTPIRTALLWHWMKYDKHFPGYINEDLLDRIPGQHGNRMSLLGEINWIFTAVTDTIAWCCFPVDIFQKLFRQDLLVASIYRNYLLAERLMRAFGCHPCSWPQLKPTHDHRMWKAWDHSLDLLFHHLPKVLRVLEASPHRDLHFHHPSVGLVDSDANRSNQASLSETIQKLLIFNNENAPRLAGLLREADNRIAARQQQLQEQAPPGYEAAATNSRSSRSRHGAASHLRSPKFVIEPVGGGGVVMDGIIEEAAVPGPSNDAAVAEEPPVEAHGEENGAGSGDERHPSEESEDYTFSESSEDDMEEPSEAEDDDEEEEEEEVDEVLREAAAPVAPPSPTTTAPVVHAERFLEPIPVPLPPPPVVKPFFPLQPDSSPPLSSARPLGLIPTRTVRSALYAVSGAAGVAVANPRQFHHLHTASRPVQVSRPQLDPYVPPDYRPANFFTTQMTAFQTCLKQAPSASDQKDAKAAEAQQRLTATQLPILLQVLLSQTHRIRALLLLSEFLDLGPWAVSHCITVGILPYIVRLFHSNVAEVKPHLVFIWAKIIASAQIDFSRLEGMRDSGYRYFMVCLQNRHLEGDSTSSTGFLSPLVRTMAVFALAKMLVRADTGAADPDFQHAYYAASKSSALSTQFVFIPCAAEVLVQAGVGCSLELRHLKLWLLLAMGRAWYRCDEARWNALSQTGGGLMDEVLLPFLHDPSPKVRAAAVFALGTLMDNYSSEPRNRQESESLVQLAGLQLVAKARDPCPLVRCELLVALCGFVYMCESLLVEEAYRAMGGILSDALSSFTSPSETSGGMETGMDSLEVATGGKTSTAAFGSPSGAAAFLRGVWTRSKTRSRLDSTDSHHHNAHPMAFLDLQAMRSLLPPAVQRSTMPIHSNPPVFTEELPSVMSETICSRLWSTIVTLANDPQPTVSCLASIIFNYVIRKVILQYNLSEKYEMRKGVFCLRPDLHLGDSSDASPSTSGGRQRHNAGSDLYSSMTEDDEPEVAEEDEEVVGLEHVRTDFFNWCSRWFSEPLLHRFPTALQLHFDSLGLTFPPPSTSTSGDTEALQCVASLSAISKDRSYFNYISRQSKQASARVAGLQRWAAITGGLPATGKLHSCPSNPTPSFPPRSHSPLAPCRRSRRHPATNTLENLHQSNSGDKKTPQACSSSVVMRVPSDESGRPCAMPSASYQALNVFEGRTGSVPTMAAFHPYKPHLFVAEVDRLGRHALAVWGVRRAELLQRISPEQEEETETEGSAEVEDTKKKKQKRTTVSKYLAREVLTKRMAKRNLGRPRITGLEVINVADERSLVLTASLDGCLRVWQNYEGKPTTSVSSSSSSAAKSGKAHLLTSWAAFDGLLQTSPADSWYSGVVTNWNGDCSSQLAVSGDVRIVRLFDTDQEARVRDIPTQATCAVTKLTRAHGDDCLIAAGFADGVVKLFDARISANAAVVFEGTVRAPDGNRVSSRPVLDVAFAPFSSNRRFYAVNADGVVNAWDIDGGATAPVFTSVPQTAVSSDATSSSVPLNCAQFYTNLPCTRSHMIAYGTANQAYVSRVHDGRMLAAFHAPTSTRNSTIGSGSLKGVTAVPQQPTCAAFHPYEPLVAFGMSDSSVHLIKFRVPS